MNQINEATKEGEQLLESLRQLKKDLVFMKAHFRPVFNGEIYLNGEEVCKLLHIGKRTLQQYRDDRILPYVQIQGKILFKESDILKLLEKNYWPSKPHF